MKKDNQYEWLIVVEGKFDIGILLEYLRDTSKRIISVGGRDCSLNMNAWTPNFVDVLQNDLGRIGFKGIIIVIDSDENCISSFETYQRCSGFSYRSSLCSPAKDSSGVFWLLDEIIGKEILPIRGINVPLSSTGCLETDLLLAYGFPIKSQPEYAQCVEIIKQATVAWKISNNMDGNAWWAVNEETKMDKFIYRALIEGFKLFKKYPILPSELDVIRNIRIAMQ